MGREWDADAYHRISGPQFSWGKKVLDRAAIRGDELVMDAGCGTGKLTAELLQQLPRGRVVAVDLSHNMLASAREYLKAEFDGQVLFAAANLLALPFRGVFDGIFSTAAFHWVPDHDQLFRNLHDALKPGGWLIAQCGGAGNLYQLLARVDKLASEMLYREYLGNYDHPWVFSDPETAARRLRQAGFAEVETGLEPAPTRFDTAEKYSEFVSKVILHRHLEKLPEAVRGSFMDALVEEAARDNPAFELDYWRLNLRGRKR